MATGRNKERHATLGNPQSKGKQGIPKFIRQTLPGLWLFFAWHLLALAAAVGVDTAFVFSQAGLFAGTLMLAGAAMCLLLAALYWPTCSEICRIAHT